MNEEEKRRALNKYKNNWYKKKIETLKKLGKLREFLKKKREYNRKYYIRKKYNTSRINKNKSLILQFD